MPRFRPIVWVFVILAALSPLIIGSGLTWYANRGLEIVDVPVPVECRDRRIPEPPAVRFPCLTSEQYMQVTTKLAYLKTSNRHPVSVDFEWDGTIKVAYDSDQDNYNEYVAVGKLSNDQRHELEPVRVYQDGIYPGKQDEGAVVYRVDENGRYTGDVDGRVTRGNGWSWQALELLEEDRRLQRTRPAPQPEVIYEPGQV